jgi:putative hydrolase of the HAD superfamily
LTVPAISRRVRALLLDVGGVVIRTPFELLDLAEERLGLDAGELGPRGPFALDADPEFREALTGALTERDYWARRAERAAPVLGIPPDTRSFMRVLFDAPEDRLVRPEVHDLMEEARSAGVPVGLLTNDLRDFHGRAWVESLRVFATPDVTIDGSLTGVLKPDPRAYELALEALDLPAAEVVFLDDQPVNIRGAVTVGLQVVPVDVTTPASAVSRTRALLELAATPHP